MLCNSSGFPLRKFSSLFWGISTTFYDVLNDFWLVSQFFVIYHQENVICYSLWGRNIEICEPAVSTVIHSSPLMNLSNFSTITLLFSESTHSSTYHFKVRCLWLWTCLLQLIFESKNDFLAIFTPIFGTRDYRKSLFRFRCDERNFSSCSSEEKNIILYGVSNMFERLLAIAIVVRQLRGGWWVLNCRKEREEKLRKLTQRYLSGF